MALTARQRDCLGLMTRHDTVSAELLQANRLSEPIASRLVGKRYAIRVFVGPARIEHFKITDTGRRAWSIAMGFPPEDQGVRDYEPHPFEEGSGRHAVNGGELCRLCDQLGGRPVHMREGVWS